MFFLIFFLYWIENFLCRLGREGRAGSEGSISIDMTHLKSEIMVLFEIFSFYVFSDVFLYSIENFLCRLRRGQGCQ